MIPASHASQQRHPFFPTAPVVCDELGYLSLGQKGPQRSLTASFTTLRSLSLEEKVIEESENKTLHQEKVLEG